MEALFGRAPVRLRKSPAGLPFLSLYSHLSPAASNLFFRRAGLLGINVALIEFISAPSQGGIHE
jgi:hypothetical protein